MEIVFSDPLPLRQLVNIWKVNIGKFSYPPTYRCIREIGRILQEAEKHIISMMHSYNFNFLDGFPYQILITHRLNNLSKSSLLAELA